MWPYTYILCTFATTALEGNYNMHISVVGFVSFADYRLISTSEQALPFVQFFGAYPINLRWLQTVHVWLHYENLKPLYHSAAFNNHLK